MPDTESASRDGTRLSSRAVNLSRIGVDASERLSHGETGKAAGGQAWSPTGLARCERNTSTSSSLGYSFQPRGAKNRWGKFFLSFLHGGRTETWTMEKAKRARKAETPKQPSHSPRLRAPYLSIPTPANARAGSNRSSYGGNEMAEAFG
jgi:hypothetical protein